MWLELHSGAHFYTSAISAKIVPKTPQNAQDNSPIGHKMARRHLGPILAPSSAILPPFWASRACPKSAKTASWTFFLPRSPPRAPRAHPGLDFSAFRVDFFKLSGQIFLGFSLSGSTFLHGFPKGAHRKDQAGKKGAGGTRRRRLRYLQLVSTCDKK